MTTVLFVEDDVDLREELSDYLMTAGYHVKGVGSVADAEVALAQPFDLLILDINLPDGSGMELCRRLRPYIRSGIVMCTGRSERELRIGGLKDGADAYLVKPVDPEELEATLISISRRMASVTSSMVEPAPLPVQWRLDRTRQTLTGPSGKVLNLSQGESLLLRCILENPAREASRAALIERFSQSDLPTNGHRIEALISRLRGKVLEQMKLSLPLHSIYGQGYSFLDHVDLI
ncbi:MAG: response regulator transcription factor [Rhodoferax sp.]|nr:response regulator transcription factor [Rhodoferax sp.]